MSESDFAPSRIFVFERSFAVGFCPSIQMYSAVIFAKDVNLQNEIAKDSRRSGLVDWWIRDSGSRQLSSRGWRRRRAAGEYAEARRRISSYVACAETGFQAGFAQLE